MRVSITGRVSSENVYCQLMRDSDGAVWDVAGSAWVTRSSNTAGTYVTLAWDSTDLQHAGTITTTSAHPSPTAGAYQVLIYKRLGSSPAVSTDTLLGMLPVVLQLGTDKLVAEPVGVEFSGAIDGSDIAVQAWLTVGGVTVDVESIDSGAECEIVIKEQDSGVELISETISDITADGHFELSVADAVSEANSDKNYFATVTITLSGVDYSREVPLTTAG